MWEEDTEVTYNIYTATIMANEIIKDRNREAIKQRRWLQAINAKRQKGKAQR